MGLYNKGWVYQSSYFIFTVIRIGGKEGGMEGEEYSAKSVIWNFLWCKWKFGWWRERLGQKGLDGFIWCF